MDEQLRQELAVPEPALLDNFDGTLLVCAGSTVLSLCPVPWEAQVQVSVVWAGRSSCDSVVYCVRLRFVKLTESDVVTTNME